MPPDYPINHIDQYMGLPELEIPVVKDDRATGRICRVLAVNFYLALISDCRSCGLEPFEIPLIGRCALPAIVLHEGNTAKFHRLPNSLAEWVYELMGDANYEARFPATIEFGLRRDEHYARFIAAARQPGG